MISQILSFLVLLAFVVIGIVVFGIWLHFNLKKNNEKSREEAMKVQCSEPGIATDEN